MKGFATAVLLLGLVIVYWKIALVIAIVAIAVMAVPAAWRERQDDRAAQRHRSRGLQARADQQLTWWYEGDERAVYGPRRA